MSVYENEASPSVDNVVFTLSGEDHPIPRHLFCAKSHKTGTAPSVGLTLTLCVKRVRESYFGFRHNND